MVLIFKRLSEVGSGTVIVGLHLRVDLYHKNLQEVEVGTPVK